MKQLFLKITYIFVISLLMLLITGGDCNKSSGTGPATVEDLVGTWVLTSVSAFGETYTPEEAEMDMTLIMNADGTYTRIFTEDSVTETYTGTWSISGNTLIIVEDGETMSIPYTFSGNTLTLTMEEDDIEFQMTFTKLP